jgi:hypothetical protein
MPAINNELGGIKIPTRSQQHDLGSVTSPSQTSEDVFLTPTEAAKAHISVWTPTLHQRLIMFTLSIVSFMVALDACIIITSLNVRFTYFLTY